MNLSKNDLEGPLPPTIGDLKELRNLNVEKNSITGKLPESVFDLRQLRVLNLNGNLFSGTLSDEIGELGELGEGHFGDNQFEGEIPSALGRLLKLELLRLQDNHNIEGKMPQNVCDLRDEKLDELWSDCATPPDPPQVDCEIDVCCTLCFPGGS